jgi:RNA polymerase sigma-70 factor (sigma-E family)
MRRDEQGLQDFLVGRHGQLYRTAFLLCASPQDAEDLVQSALVKVILGWRRLERIDNPDAYARQTLVNLFISSQRRLWRRESPHAELPDVASAPADTDLALTVRTALAALPVKQRAVLVLRYWEDLSVEATATALGMREGTVKSHCSRGIAALRVALPGALGELWEREQV